MAIPVKPYLCCWFLGAAVQSAVYFSFNAVDYFNFFFPKNYKPEVYIAVSAGVGASVGAIITVACQPRRTHLKILLVTQTTSAALLVAEVVITSLDSAMSTPLRFAVVLALIFATTVAQNVGGGALYGFAGKHFPSFGVQAAQSGGVCAFAATFVMRCVSKGSFEQLRDRRRGFQLSGYLFVGLLDMVILLACCFIAGLRNHQHANNADLTRQQHEQNELERTPLLSKDESGTQVLRRDVIRNNITAFATISLTLIISNALFPGITSQFHESYNCSSTDHSVEPSKDMRGHSGFRASSVTPTTELPASNQTGWFVVVLFGCYAVAGAIGKNLPILGIIYNKSTVILNCLLELVIAIPITLIYFKPCVSELQADWVAYLTVGLLGLVHGYGVCCALILLAPGEPGKKREEGLATSIGYTCLQFGRLSGTGTCVFLVEYVYGVLT